MLCQAWTDVFSLGVNRLMFRRQEWLALASATAEGKLADRHVKR